MALLRHGVLVREDGVGAPGQSGVVVCGVGGGGGDGRVGGVEGAGVGGVDGRDHAEVVLVFVEVVGGCGAGVVERVQEGGVEGAEGEFVDLVREVEGWGCLC